MTRKVYSYEQLKKDGMILLETIVGSTAYGTNIATSDIDKKFVYIAYLEDVLIGDYPTQINVNGSDDFVGLEISKFLNLLEKSSPNILDLVATPEDCIIHCDPLYRKYFIDKSSSFLTKKARYSFGDYAKAQIQKARGTNKKIVNPLPKERKGLKDFIWTTYKNGTPVLLSKFLSEKGLTFTMCGLSNVDHMKNFYNVFVDPQIEKNWENAEKEIIAKRPFYKKILKGIYHFDFTNAEKKEMKKIVANNLYYYKPAFKGVVDVDNVQPVLTSIPKGLNPICQAFINTEGFTAYCGEYKEYWEWVEKRNEQRYLDNVNNGCQYDTKNMSHCHRLLDMCIEILRDKKINVRRENREKLLSIRNGEYSYDNLIADANEKIGIIESLFKDSDLPQVISKDYLDKIILELRIAFYEKSSL